MAPLAAATGATLRATAKTVAKTSAKAATGTAAVATSVVDAASDAGTKTLRRPRAIVRRTTSSYSELAWTFIVTLLALSLLALLLRVSVVRPGVISPLFNFVPDLFRQFVNPFGDQPLGQITPPRQAA